MSEEKKGIILNVAKRKFLGAQMYNIFVTDKRLIFSRITKQDFKDHDKQLNDSVKGKSLKERLSLIANHRYELPKRYFDMSIDTIIQENPDNFELDFDDITHIKVKRPKSTDDKGRLQDRYFMFQTKTDKFKVGPAHDEYISLLNEVLGEKAKKPRFFL